MLEIITPSISTPLELYAVKDFLRISDDTEDYILQDIIIPSVIRNFENLTGKALMTQTLRERFNGFSKKLKLSRSPIQSITNVKYKDINGAWQTLDALNYNLVKNNFVSFIEISYGGTFPTVAIESNNVEVNYIAGYGDLKSNVDPTLTLPLLLLIQHAWTNRGLVNIGSSVIEIDTTMKMVLQPYMPTNLC